MQADGLFHLVMAPELSRDGAEWQIRGEKLTPIWVPLNGRKGPAALITCPEDADVNPALQHMSGHLRHAISHGALSYQ